MNQFLAMESFIQEGSHASVEYASGVTIPVKNHSKFVYLSMKIFIARANVKETEKRLQ